MEFIRLARFTHTVYERLITNTLSSPYINIIKIFLKRQVHVYLSNIWVTTVVKTSECFANVFVHSQMLNCNQPIVCKWFSGIDIIEKK